MDIQLLIALLIGVAAIVFIVLKTRLDAFVALLFAGVLTGLIAGATPAATIGSMTKGFGSTLGSVGIVIGLGVGLGKLLEVSGAADAIAQWFIRAFGKGREEWAMSATGSVVSIPVFCDSGFIIMNPLARSIARRRKAGYAALALALGCGMTLTHHMVPPTPGPLAVAGILGVDIGSVILTGIVFTILLTPVVVLYAKWIGPKVEASIDADIQEAVFGTGEEGDEPADPTAELGVGPNGEGAKKLGLFGSFAPLLVPLILIVANTVTTAVDKSSQNALAAGAEYTPSELASFLGFLGHPVIALVIGLVIAVYGILPGWVPRKKVHGWLAEAAASAGLILLITGAGGAFGQVLRDSGVGDALAQAVAQTALPGFLVPFVIATLVRMAQGSGTVAMITAASVSAPLVGTIDVSGLAFVMACCTGSMATSYFNDSYFWVVTKFTGLDGTAALKAWTGITTAAWAGSIPLLFVLSLLNF